MQRVAKVFQNNRSQAVRIPKEFQFSTSEVTIRKEGEDVILTPRVKTWAEYFATATPVPADFMDDVEELPLQERDLW